MFPRGTAELGAGVGLRHVPITFTITPAADDESLEHTPTWAVGVVCIFFVLVSLFIERVIYHIGKWLKIHNHWALHETLEKMKGELMLLGFISLLLTFSQNYLSRICIPVKLSESMLPCKESANVTDALPPEGQLLNAAGLMKLKERLSHSCPDELHPLMSTESIHQLHIFIFLMAIVHISYSCMTMLLGLLQMRGWTRWEDEAHDLIRGGPGLEGPSASFKIGRTSSFVQKRAQNPWTRSIVVGVIINFCRQFGKSVTKADYSTLRQAFIKIPRFHISSFRTQSRPVGHNSFTAIHKNHNTGKQFNFLNYMTRTLEEEFKVVVGISVYLWIFVITFLVLNVHGWYTYFWISFTPAILLLIIGTKLQQVITQLAVEASETDGYIWEGIKLRDDLFWFKSPRLLLFVIHFILFQNAFELAYFFWLWVQFGLDSCFLEEKAFIYVRVLIGFASQFICSYTTLPLYALVTQLGSTYKRGIFEAPVESAIHNWHRKAMENRRKREGSVSKHNSDFSLKGKLRFNSFAKIVQHKKMQKVCPENSDDEIEAPAQMCSESVPSSNITVCEENCEHSMTEILVQQRNEAGTAMDTPTVDISVDCPTDSVIIEIARVEPSQSSSTSTNENPQLSEH